MKNIFKFRLLKRLSCLLFAGSLFCACDDIIAPNIPDPDEEKPIAGYLSLQASLPQLSTRATGTEIEDGEGIYNMGVYVFDKSGLLIGQKFEGRKQVSAVDRKYEKAYQEQSGEMTGIEVTSGQRDVYIVANVTDEEVFKNENNSYFSTKSGFSQLFEKLSFQGEYQVREANQGKYTPASPENPNSGYDLPDWEDHLTMFIAYEGLLFDEPHPKPATGEILQYYMGYDNYVNNTTNIIKKAVLKKESLSELNTIELKRLVARVAIKNITFELNDPVTGNTELAFDGDEKTANYEFELDSVFLLNVPAKSAVSDLSNLQIFDLNHGSEKVFSLFNGNDLFGLYIESQFDESLDLYAGIVANNEGNYDISDPQAGEGRLKNTPLWFYVFENKGLSNQYPICFVISVKFRYKYTAGALKEKIYYYPVVIKDGQDNYLIERNMQYELNITIRGLAPEKGVIAGIETVIPASINYLDVTTRKGENLFPWVGNTYIN